MEYTGEPIYFQAWNRFDEWGLLLSLPRINSETVPSYRDRLEDVIRHRGGAQHLNLFYGINRDLGLNVYHNALTIQTAKNAEGQPICIDAMIEVKSSGIFVGTSAFRIIREAEVIPSDTLRVHLARKVANRDIVVEYPLGTRLPPDQYSIDWDRNELIFRDQDYSGVTIAVSYLYYEVVPTYNMTLQQVIDRLNAITTPGGDGVLIASLNGVSGTMSAEGIPLLAGEYIEAIHSTPTGEYYDSYILPCGEASLRALADEDFIQTMMGSGDVYFGTELIRWVEQVKNITKFGWENLIFDETRLTDILGLTVIPTLADAKTTLWRASKPTQTAMYSASEADELGYQTGDDILRRFGFADTDMQSGVGGKNDLKVIVEDGDQSFEFTPVIYDFYTLPTGDPNYTGDFLDLLNEGF